VSSGLYLTALGVLQPPTGSRWCTSNICCVSVQLLQLW